MWGPMNFRALGEYDQIVKLTGNLDRRHFPIVVRSKNALIDLSEAEIDFDWSVATPQRLIDVGPPDPTPIPFEVRDGLLWFDSQYCAQLDKVGQDTPVKIKTGMLRFDPNEWDKMAWGTLDSMGAGAVYAFQMGEVGNAVLQANYYESFENAMGSVSAGQRQKLMRRRDAGDSTNMQGKLEGALFTFDRFTRCDILWPENDYLRVKWGPSARHCALVRARTSRVEFLNELRVEDTGGVLAMLVDSRLEAQETISVVSTKASDTWPIVIWGGEAFIPHFETNHRVLSYERRPAKIAIGSVRYEVDGYFWPDLGMDASAINCNGPCDRFTIDELDSRVKWSVNGTPPTVGELLKEPQ